MPEGATIWFTGLPAAGKTTLARALRERLAAAGLATCCLDGDELRRGLCADLGFSPADRAENVRRVGHVASLLAGAGVVALVSVISPYARDRAAARSRHERAGLAFLEVWMSTPLTECERRDPRGLYARARAGELTEVTGIDAPYEPPRSPEVTVGVESVDRAAERCLAALAERGIVPVAPSLLVAEQA